MPEPTMDLEARRRAERQLARSRVEAREEYVRQAEVEARADHAYELTRATAFLDARGKGAPVTEAEMVARKAAADHKLERDIAHSLARAALLRISETERSQVAVRDMHSASERIDGLVAA